MPPTTQDHSFTEDAQFRFGFGYNIIESGNLLLEDHFGLVSLGCERVEGIREAVIENRQFRNALGWNYAWQCWECLPHVAQRIPARLGTTPSSPSRSGILSSHGM